MKILLTGASGQLGRELNPRLGRMGHLTAVDRTAAEPGLVEQDLSDLDQLESLLERVQPDVVVNAAAYTAVDQAERESAKAFRLNAELPGCIARWCRRNDRFVLHFSTDYIFGGKSSRPYRETDEPRPLNVYGASKLAGEWAVVASGCAHLILRTSWVYSTHGKNFVLSMLNLARQRPELNIVSDQIGCPTWARNLARVAATVLSEALRNPADSSCQGVFHYCDNDVTSWYEFACLIFTQALQLGLLSDMPRVKAIASAEFPQQARRPSYSALDTSALVNRFGLQPPELKSSLFECLQEASQ